MGYTSFLSSPYISVELGGRLPQCKARRPGGAAATVFSAAHAARKSRWCGQVPPPLVAAVVGGAGGAPSAAVLQPPPNAWMSAALDVRRFCRMLRSVWASASAVA